MKIAGCRIIGGMAPSRGKAPFDRAAIVVERRAEPGTYLQVRAYVGPDEVDGKPLRQDEWDALLASEQALQVVAGREPMIGTALWVLRRNFEGREAALEELRTSGTLLRDFIRGPDGSFLCFVREPDANALRDRWAAAAHEDALCWAREGRWPRALDSATRAFVLDRAMNPERIALLTLAYERCDRGARAEGYLEMARRSRGEDFANKIQERQQDLRKRLAAPEPVPDSGTRLKYEAQIHKCNRDAMRAGLKRLKRQKSAA